MRELMIGEALVGDGNEVAHIDLLIGPKHGAVGAAFARCLADQTAGHNALLAVLAPNVPAKPSTVMFNKVTIKGSTQAVQIFGSAQAAVAKAVADPATRKRLIDIGQELYPAEMSTPHRHFQYGLCRSSTRSRKKASKGTSMKP